MLRTQQFSQVLFTTILLSLRHQSQHTTSRIVIRVTLLSHKLGFI